MRYSSFYNDAKIYLYPDNPEAAIKEAEGLIVNDCDSGDGKSLKKAEEMTDSFKKGQVNFHHFLIDFSNA